MSSMASFFIKKYLKITYARASHCTQPFSAPFPPYPKEKGKTPGWKRGNNSMAMQPPPLMSCPETTSCFSEMIIASTTLKGSINQSEVKLFLEYCSLILTYVNSVLCNIMSNMGKHSFTFGQRPTKCKRRMKQWYAVKLYVTLSCRSAFIIFSRMEAHYFITIFVSECYHDCTKIKHRNDWNKRLSELETSLLSQMDIW